MPYRLTLKPNGKVRAQRSKDKATCNDLKAQWSMAVIAYFGLLAGFLGLVAIIGTLWQTRYSMTEHWGANLVRAYMIHYLGWLLCSISLFRVCSNHRFRCFAT